MISLPLTSILPFLLLAVRWTLLLSAIAFVGGGIGSLLLLLLRYAQPGLGAKMVYLYVQLIQGTPLLLQLFIVFFGLPLLGVSVTPLLAASVGLILYASAFLTEIWRGCVDAVPRGQWHAAHSLGMSFLQQMRYVILPQALRIAVPPTVGFLVQLVKSTALTSIVGYDELMKSGQIITNATFQPFFIYGLVALIYFALCYPLTSYSRALEKRFREAG